jgi:hypothetical protein
VTLGLSTKKPQDGDKRRDQILKRMLEMPHKPHAPTKQQRATDALAKGNAKQDKKAR